MPFLAILLYALTVTQPTIVGSVPSNINLPECGDQPCNVCGYNVQCSWQCAEGYLDVDENDRLVCKK